MTAKILVIDDEKLIRWTLNDVLRREGYDVLTAECGETGLEIVEGERPDLIILDLRLPGMDGMEVLERVKEIAPDAVVIILTAYGSPASALQAIKLGAHEYLHKPFELEETREAVRMALGTLWNKKETQDSATEGVA